MKRLFLGLFLAFGLLSQGVVADITTGLVAHYPFDGNANDSSGNNYHGAYSNFATGKYGQGVSFDGTQYFTISSIAGALPAGGEPRTLSVWVKQSQADAGNYISWGYTNNHQRFSLMDFQNNLNLSQHTDDFTTSYQTVANQWKHYVITYDGTDKIKFYVDGVFIVEITKNVLTTTSNQPLVFGARPTDFGESFHGILDEVRIYNRALSATDVTELYNYAPQPKLTLKAHGGAVQFAGGAPKIELNISSMIGQSSFTIEGWLNMASYTDVGYANPITELKDASTNDFKLGIEPSDGLNFNVIDGNGVGSNSLCLGGNNSYMPNEWQHIAIVKNAQNQKIYVNGVEKCNVNASVLKTLNTGIFKLHSPKGAMDEIRIWNSAKTSAEINATMNIQLDGNESGLVAYYNFDERVGSKVLDLTLNNHDSMIEGNVTRLNFLGDSLSFDGVSDGVGRSAMNLAGNQLTIGSWINVKSSVSLNSGSVILRNSWTNIIYRISNGNISFEWDATGDADNIRYFAAAVTDNMFLNQWRYLTLVFENNSTDTLVKLYIDGNLSNSQIFAPESIFYSSGQGYGFGIAATVIPNLPKI